jgi:hypothetical protein
VNKESRSRRPSREEDADQDEDARPRVTERQEHAKEVSEEAGDLLDEMDDIMRKSLDLKEDATDKEFEERSQSWILSYVQKGGQ